MPQAKTNIQATTPQSKRRDPESQSLAHQVMVAFNSAFKKILLYPQDHVIFQTAVNKLIQELNQYLQLYGTLQYRIDQKKIHHQEEEVHAGPLSEENLAFILFRDGIYLLEFQPAIEQWEVYQFLEVLQKHQILTEDAENDIVTALWEMELPHLGYEAEDVGFDTGADFSIPELGGVVDGEVYDGEFGGENDGDYGAAEDGETSASNDADSTGAASVDGVLPLPIDLNLRPAFDWNLVEITNEDRDYIQDLLLEEEKWERIEYVLYILFYILHQQRQPDDFSKVMAFLIQELKDALKNYAYESVYNTLQKLNNSLYSPKSENHWSAPMLADLFGSLSKNGFLGVLAGDWQNISACNVENLGHLKRALLLLNADIVVALGPMLLEAQSKKTRKLLMTVIGIQAERDYQPFKDLLQSSDIELMVWLAHVMGFMQNDGSLTDLQMLINHTSAAVRETALKSLFRRSPKAISELGNLLADPNESIRQLFLRYAGKHRDCNTEKLLRDYLKTQRIRSSNKQILFQVYQALGKCGSDASIPFLKKHMYILPGFSLLRSQNALNRQVAMQALIELKTVKAETLIKKTSKQERSYINPAYFSETEDKYENETANRQ